MKPKFKVNDFVEHVSTPVSYMKIKFVVIGVGIMEETYGSYPLYCVAYQSSNGFARGFMQENELKPFEEK